MALQQRCCLVRQLHLQKLLLPPQSRTLCRTSFAAPRFSPRSTPRLSQPTLWKVRQASDVATQKKNWWKHEARQVARYTILIWGSAACVFGIFLAINEEWVEWEYPTPHEWSFWTRSRVRAATQAADTPGPKGVNYSVVINHLLYGLKRLEDPKIDGSGVRELLNDEPLTIEGLGSVGKDISAKDENWRRGYFEAMLLLANSLEHVDGWVRDKRQKLVCPPDMVVGPSNPEPRPMPPGSPPAPREEDCETAYESAENVYLRILTTKGLTAKQRTHAALSYASFLDFKKMPVAADRVYDWALSIATESIPASSPPLVNPRTWTLDNKSASPPENVLTVLTARATSKARAGDVAAALPIFVSVLRARRAFPSPAPNPLSNRAPTQPTTLWEKLWTLAQPREYPPSPPDGTQPSVRDEKELCEEAALQLYIGEIIYASKDSARTHEEGIAWTREGVDLAEEQLRSMKPGLKSQKDARTTCRQCLATGLENWSVMVERLARKEEAQRMKVEEGTGSSPTATATASGTSSGFGGFWSSSKQDGHDAARWVAEEKVVHERIQRTRELMVDQDPPLFGLKNLFQA